MRHRRENVLWLDGQNLVHRHIHCATLHLQMIFIAKDLIASHRQALTVAQHDVFGPRSRRGERHKHHAQGQVLQPHGATSRSANSSMAAATPLSSLDAVSCQPKFLSSGTQFPITTGTPAKESISR